MVWNAQNSPFAGGTNYAAYSAPNYAAYVGQNYAAYGAPNYAAYSAPNYAAYSAPNYAAYSAPNYAAYSSPNYAAYPGIMAPAAALPMAPASMIAGGTGAGGASGSGFIGGYGPIARFEYATPAALAPLPWVLDFANGDGWPSFPFELRINPYACDPPLQWQPGDWDPGLRFWSLEFDPKLTEWLQDLNLGAPAVVAAREFANASDDWLARDKDKSPLHKRFEADREILSWQPEDAAGWNAITKELDELVDLMRDDRMRYLDELGVQSGQATPYFVHLMRFDSASKPWTMELMNCATSIGNIIKMQYKSHYRRVRASTLCPGLTPPWGPAQHPAFPSGHSTVAHLAALFLLSVPGIAHRFGIFEESTHIGRAPLITDFDPPGARTRYGQDQRSPLLWLAWRIAKGRERLGVHYASDSAAGRRLAALVWHACLGGGSDPSIDVPALKTVLTKAQAEWPPLAKPGKP
jgi:hypothetical protein